MIHFLPAENPKFPWYAAVGENDNIPECSYHDNGFETLDDAVIWIKEQFKGASSHG